MAKDRVPDSCCINITVGCGNDFKESTIHTQVERRHHTRAGDAIGIRVGDRGWEDRRKGQREGGRRKVEASVSTQALSLQGCVETIATWLRKNILLVAGAALGIAFVEVRSAVGLDQLRASGEQEALAWKQWLLGGFGEACPVSSPPSFPSFLSGLGDYLLLLSGEEYPEWLRSNVGGGGVSDLVCLFMEWILQVFQLNGLFFQT